MSILKECYSCIYLKSEFSLRDGKIVNHIDKCEHPDHAQIIEDMDKGCDDYKQIPMPGINVITTS